MSNFALFTPAEIRGEKCQSGFYELDLRPNLLYSFDWAFLGRLRDGVWVSKSPRAKHKGLYRLLSAGLNDV